MEEKDVRLWRRQWPATLTYAQVHLSLFHFRHNIFTNWGYDLVDCKVGDWKPWGECSLTCGGGTKTRARDVIVEPEYGGETCPALEETMVCNTIQCPGALIPCLLTMTVDN